jgi:hypothetical protein
MSRTRAPGFEIIGVNVCSSVAKFGFGLGKSLRDADVLRLGEETQRFLAAFAADGAGSHADASALMSFRSEAFTFFEFGKTFATSGSRITTLVPSA